MRLDTVFEANLKVKLRFVVEKFRSERVPPNAVRFLESASIRLETSLLRLRLASASSSDSAPRDAVRDEEADVETRC